MQQWRKDARREAIIVDLDRLVPQDHLLRKIETVMDYEWLNERLEPYYCHDNGRPGTDPVVLIKMVLIQHFWHSVPPSDTPAYSGYSFLSLVSWVRSAG